ncbi:MAG: glycerol-3-phosphate dehydrogenase subunit GlpB [Acidimicrobiales bacterium]
MRADVVVVGAGTAGLVAAARLAEAGRRVVVVARGVGSTRLAPGTIDVLGYAPERVDRPGQALPGFLADHPEHPYARVGVDVLAEAIEWLRDHVTIYRYLGSLEENLLLPTAVGAAKPSAVVPETMAAGDLRDGGSFLLCGLRGFKDFFPALAADNLRAGAKVEARAVELALPTGGEADVGSLAFARRFGDADFRQAVVSEVLAAVAGEEAVGFPAVLGLSRPAEVWSALEDALGRPVFEIPTVPPSVPGIRLLGALETAVRSAGGRLLVGSEVVGALTSGSRVDAVVVRTAARDVEYEAGSFVLATGGFLTGGIELGSDGQVRESVLGLPVGGLPEAGEPLFLPEYFAAHPLAAAGLSTDLGLRPVGPDGSVLYENLHAAGAVLAGAEPWREKSGEGISLGTGFRAAGEILERDA